MNDKTIVSLAAIVAGCAIMETALVMGVDGAAIASGAAIIGAGIGVPIGYGLSEKKKGE